MQKFDVIILGAGAAGLMAALSAGQRGKKVLVLESSNKIGKKILMSGGGRCNFTNYYVEDQNFLCRNPHFVKSALSQYTQWDFITLVNQHGIAFHERDHGQLFCDNSAKDILKMLKTECENVSVDIRVKAGCEKISRVDDTYFLNTKIGKFSSSSLVIATGGLSIPSLGGSGYGYDIARQFGLEVFTLDAGLVPLTFSDWFKTLTESLSGIAVDAIVTSNQQSFRENILFTHRGLSGPAILQISNYWQNGNSVEINLLPDIDVYHWLLESKAKKGNQTLKSMLTKSLPKNLVDMLCERFWQPQATKPLSEIADKQLEHIATQLHHFSVKPSGTEGYRTAEVTRGGVNTDHISSKTMECRNQPGLYFVGEVLDVTGHLGGFNFQWAWSSGYVAGQNC